MSEENVEIVRRVSEAWARGDLDAAAATAAFDLDVTWFAPPGPDGGVYQGIEALAHQSERWRLTWSEFEQEIHEVIDAGDHVLVVATQRGRGRASGVEAEITYGTLFTLLGGKIIRVQTFEDREEAERRLGLKA